MRLDPNRLIFDGEWSEPLPEQMTRYVNKTMQVVGITTGYGECRL